MEDLEQYDTESSLSSENIQHPDPILPLGTDPTIDLCTVCYTRFDEVQEDTHILSECGHKFHTSCIINWFRSDSNATCPLCRDDNYTRVGITDNYDSKSRLALVLNYGRRLEAPVDLKKRISSLNKDKDKLQIAKELKKSWTNSEKGKHFHALWKEHRDIESKIWRIKRRIRTKESEIRVYPILPIFVIKYD
jgi:hypothetical protein